MASATDFGYAQARMQARHAERLGEADWHALAAIGDFSAFLAAARETPLKRRLRGISPRSSVHELESQLRAELLESIAEVARWVPRAWRDAVDWCAALLYLPLARCVSLSGAPVGALGEEWERWRERLAAAGSQDDALAHWAAAWRAAWPAASARERRALDALGAALRAHRRGLAALAGGAELPGREAWARRRALGAQMLKRFRSGLMTPVAVFAYLVLDALDLERLRGELVLRRLFAARAA